MVSCSFQYGLLADWQLVDRFTVYLYCRHGIYYHWSVQRGLLADRELVYRLQCIFTAGMVSITTGPSSVVYSLIDSWCTDLQCICTAGMVSITTGPSSVVYSLIDSWCTDLQCIFTAGMVSITTGPSSVVYSLVESWCTDLQCICTAGMVSITTGPSSVVYSLIESWCIQIYSVFEMQAWYLLPLVRPAWSTRWLRAAATSPCPPASSSSSASPLRDIRLGIHTKHIYYYKGGEHEIVNPLISWIISVNTIVNELAIHCSGERPQEFWWSFNFLKLKR
jgi:hypothetical protein